MVSGSGGSKSQLAKAAGAEPAGQMRDEKVHAVVARSTFRSQNVQNTPWSDHFWKLRCRKSARRCGAKHISKSKCTKHTMLGPLLEVAMSKKCTPSWREVHFEVKMYKTHHFRTTFASRDVEKVHAKYISKSKCTKHTIVGPLLQVEMSKKCTPLWREAHVEVKMLKAPGVRTTLDVEMSFRMAGASEKEDMSFRFSVHYTTLHSTTLHYTTQTTTNYNYSYNNNYNYNNNTTFTLRYTTLH